jgi:hypothetical protein
VFGNGERTNRIAIKLPSVEIYRKEEVMKLSPLLVLVAVLLSGGIACGNQNSLRSADASVLESYQKIYEALTVDTIEGVAENALTIVKTVKADTEKKLPITIADKAEQLSRDKDIKIAREDFKGLSSALISYLEKQNIKNSGYQENYCPMVNANWLQKESKLNNPYFGKSMPTCGENKRTF